MRIFNILFKVEAGDVIVKVNETDVHRFTTKEGWLSRYFKEEVN